MLIDFLEVDHNKNDLQSCLKIIEKFKSCHSAYEDSAIPFMAWAKLEQLEEFLEHLVNGEDLEDDTIAYIEYCNNKKSSIDKVEIQD